MSRFAFADKVVLGAGEGVQELGSGEHVMTIESVQYNKNKMHNTEKIWISGKLQDGKGGKCYIKLDADEQTVGKRLYAFAAACLGVPRSDKARLEEEVTGKVSELVEAALAGDVNGVTIQIRAEQRTARSGHPFMIYDFEACE